MKKIYYIRVVLGDKEDVRGASQMAGWIEGAMGECAVDDLDVTVWHTAADLAEDSRGDCVDGCPVCGGGMAQIDSCEVLSHIKAISGKEIEWGDRATTVSDTQRPVHSPARIMCCECAAEFILTDFGLLSMTEEEEHE